MPPSPKLKVFASPDWGEGAATHARVRTVVERLRAHGVDVWFDETHMKGGILDAMCRGIDESDVVLVFVTRRYVAKVASGDETDNVRREFLYAAARPARLLAVRFDAALAAPWSGPVGMVLGSHLYVDLARPDADVAPLVAAIRRQTPRTLWKTAVAKAPPLHVKCPSKPPAASPSGPPLATTKTPVPSSPALTCIGEAAVRAKPPPPPTTRERVARAFAALGDAPPDGAHVRDAVDALYRSLAGSAHLATLPLCDKLARVERELGLCVGGGKDDEA